VIGGWGRGVLRLSAHSPPSYLMSTKVTSVSLLAPCRRALAFCLSRAGYMFMMEGRLAEIQQVAAQLTAVAIEIPDIEPPAMADGPSLPQLLRQDSGRPVKPSRSPGAGSHFPRWFLDPVAGDLVSCARLPIPPCGISNCVPASRSPRAGFDFSRSVADPPARDVKLRPRFAIPPRGIRFFVLVGRSPQAGFRIGRRIESHPRSIRRQATNKG